MRYLTFVYLFLTLGMLGQPAVPKTMPEQIGAPPDFPGGATIPIIQNMGQWKEGALYQTQSELGTMFLAQDALWLTILEPHASSVQQALALGLEEPEARAGVHLKLSFVGSNPTPTIEPFAPLTTSINYLQGDNPDTWYTNVPVWSGVRYRNLYPGIDLELTSERGIPVRRLVVRDAHRAMLETIALRVEGANQITLVQDGINLTTDVGQFTLPLFEVVGIDTGGFTPHPSADRADTVLLPLREKRRVGEQANEGDFPLLPSNLLYSSYLGGMDDDYIYATKVDAQGAIYLGGLTESFDFPTTPGAFDPSNTEGAITARDAFITKLNPSGSALDYSTYIQGSNTDRVEALVIDGAGSVYATGYTLSRNFPTTPNVPTNGYNRDEEGFVLKLSPRGDALRYSMYLSGEDGDSGDDIALYQDGSVAVTGITSSTDFPTTPNAYDPNNPEGNPHIFVTHINAAGDELLFSTYLGGSGVDQGYGVAFDAEGHIYVTGYCGSNDFPVTPGVYGATPEMGYYSVTKFTLDGSDLLYSTTIPGGSVSNYMGDIFVDDGGNAYVTGITNRGNFPATAGAYDTECGLGGTGCGNTPETMDGILFKLNPTATELVYATYLGGEGMDLSFEVTVDKEGNAYTVGAMQSPQVLSTAGAYQLPANFVIGLWKISADGSRLLHLARIGPAVTFDLQAPDVVVYGGGGWISDYYETTPNAYDSTLAGERDGIMGRIVLPAPATTTTLSVSGGTLTSTVDNTTYTFPANIFTETVVFTHAPRHPLSLPPVAPRITIGHTFVNYAIGSNGPVEPTHPYTLQLEYNENDFSIEESSLQLWYWDGTTWQTEPTAVLDTASNRISATPNRVGWWVVTGSPHRRYLPLIQR